MEPRTKMSVAQRTKQFAPFAAITGLDRAIDGKREELDRVERRELSEESAALLDERLRALRKGMVVTISYYSEERCRSLSGTVERIEEAERHLRIAGVTVPIDDIESLSIEPCVFPTATL